VPPCPNCKPSSKAEREAAAASAKAEQEWRKYSAKAEREAADASAKARREWEAQKNQPPPKWERQERKQEPPKVKAQPKQKQDNKHGAEADFEAFWRKWKANDTSTIRRAAAIHFPGYTRMDPHDMEVVTLVNSRCNDIERANKKGRR